MLPAASLDVDRLKHFDLVFDFGHNLGCCVKDDVVSKMLVCFGCGSFVPIVVLLHG